MRRHSQGLHDNLQETAPPPGSFCRLLCPSLFQLVPICAETEVEHLNLARRGLIIIPGDTFTRGR